MEVKARCHYDDREAVASDLSFVGDPGVTKQSDALDVDVNKMFARYEKGGVLPDMIVRDGRYGDFSDVPTFQEAFNVVKTAEEQFAALDVRVRNQFDNDPVKFLEFATDEKNLDELEKWGLLKPEVVERRIKDRADKAKVVDEAAIAKAKADEDALVERVRARLAQEKQG